MELKLTFRVNYTHKDFADAELNDVAYYDEEGELIVVKEEITAEDYCNLWIHNSDGWDGELMGYSTNE